MDKKQAAEIVRKTFESPFDRTRFINFISNLLNSIDTDNARSNQGNRIPDQFNEYVSKIERVGKYTCDEKQIMIFIVHLKKETLIERARSMQRNFIAWYLKHGNDWKDAALVAFVSPDSEDWRFSLVKMDYKINEKGKIKEEFTPARRWSFLVGTHEKSHTAQSKLVPIMLDDEHNPSLGELEEAFNIEKVTKEFFNEYRALFLRTKEELDKQLDNNPKIKIDFEKNNVNTVDFAKKLLGQIVFLYFLQKKGWFGVQRDAEWGTGSKQFLRELFDKKHSSYNNFFNDILEPLFYEALRIDRTHDDHYYSRFNCKIPFLNGGLFDPINNYDWWKTDILLPDDLFSNNKRINETDTGNGILDVFDRYNFTVKEDEPLEKEVAIDPELLGKAYEKFNAIRPDNYEEYRKALKSGKKGDETKFNKQYGVYYTPREIVHYMCQQSLINYLATELEGKATKEDIEILVHFGEHISENEAHVEKIGKETDTYKSKLPESIRKNADEIDSRLAGIKVCDPAIGSGAFPVGMMSEIVKTRNVLSHFTKEQDKKERTVYHFKRDCIENSIYGVDIDSGAVEIAKLRLWLSLVVDEDDIRQIKPLPNLDYKIVRGNSLLGIPEGTLINDEKIFNELEEQKKCYFHTTNPTDKNRYRLQIDELFTQLINKIREFDPTIQEIIFDFHTHFSEVFHGKGGFDIVIGNPPYGISFTKKDNPELSAKYSEIIKGEVESYIIFYYLGLTQINKNGCLTYISPDSWFTNKGASPFRDWLLEKFSIVDVFDWYKPFDGAKDTRVHSILITASRKKKEITVKQVLPSDFSTVYRNYKIPYNVISGFKNKEWRFYLTNSERNIFNKMESISKPLNSLYNIKYGLRTGNNAEFITEKETKYPVIAGADIASLYCVEWKPKYLKKIKNLPPSYFDESNISEKIIIQYVRTNSTDHNARWLEAAYIEGNYIPLNSLSYVYIKNKNNQLKYLISILNSFLMNRYYRALYTDVNVKPTYLAQLPIPATETKIQKFFIDIVDKIHSLTQQSDYLQSSMKQSKVKEYEREIDRMIYELYGLTDEEIAIVEGEK